MTARQEPHRTVHARGRPAPARMTVLIGDAREARRGYEVTSPTRLMRAWRLLTAVNEELHSEGIDDAGARRAAMVFNALRNEVVRSISPHLAAEVRELLPPLDEDSGVAGTRAACSAALGWLDSLVTSMLMQLAEQGERAARPAATRGPGMRPERAQHRRPASRPQR
ncbi:proteasome activator [Spirillospora sp. NPDC127506]